MAVLDSMLARGVIFVPHIEKMIIQKVTMLRVLQMGSSTIIYVQQILLVSPPPVQSGDNLKIDVFICSKKAATENAAAFLYANN